MGFRPQSCGFEFHLEHGFFWILKTSNSYNWDNSKCSIQNKVYHNFEGVLMSVSLKCKKLCSGFPFFINIFDRTKFTIFDWDHLVDSYSTHHRKKIGSYSRQLDHLHILHLPSSLSMFQNSPMFSQNFSIRPSTLIPIDWIKGKTNETVQKLCREKFKRVAREIKERWMPVWQDVVKKAFIGRKRNRWREGGRERGERRYEI